MKYRLLGKSGLRIGLVAQREFRHDAPDPEESCSLRERKRIVKSAISGLRPRARNVVELIHLQEHSIRETGQILGISPEQ